MASQSGTDADKKKSGTDGTDGEREKQNENREDRIYDAAFRGDLESLKAIIVEDKGILDKVLVGGFKGKNPLNVAIATGQENIVRKLLEIKPELAEVLDAELGAALHVACSKGNLEIVKLLVGVSPGMCLARDREGNNPLHVAAMKGKVDVLKTLLQTRPNAARVKTDRGDTILHLCVNYNRLESLKLLVQMVRDQEFFDSTDASGNNILHLAVFCNQFEIIKYLLEWPKERANDYLPRQLIDVNARNGSGWTALLLLEWPKERKDDYLQRQLIDVNARNGSGWTALDILSQVGESKDNITNEYPDDKGRIEVILRKYGVKKSNELFSPFDPFWQKKEKDTLVIVSLLMAIVSLLMAMMSFQVGINPPGGVWQDTSAGHEAGKAVIAYTNPKAYSYLVYFNTIGFLLSLTTILELIVVWPTQKWAFGFIRAGILWLTIMIMAFTYTFSVIVLAPTEMYMSINLVILVTVTVWAVVIPFHRVLAFQVKLILITALMAVVISFWCMGAPTSRPKRQPTERTTWNKAY